MSLELLRHPIKQIAYFVDDIVVGAEQHHKIFGSGPYFLAEKIQLARCFHRGRESELLHSSAYGQWGEVMVEFCQQDNPGPSVFRDLFPEGRGGLHHVAIMVDDLQASLHDFAQAGYETAFYAELVGGQAYAMVDCVQSLGHFIELYEPNEIVTRVYDLVRTAAQDFTGDKLIRSFNL